jgi:hypothetical protein
MRSADGQAGADARSGRLSRGSALRPDRRRSLNPKDKQRNTCERHVLAEKSMGHEAAAFIGGKNPR